MTDPDAKRRLSAILIFDVAGNSASRTTMSTPLLAHRQINDAG